MERRRTYWAGVTALALAVVACAGAALATPAASARTSERPNIVVVLTDDQRWDTLSAMPAVEQKLVAHGVTFRNSFVVNSNCCPSRTSLLTGQYSHSTGVYKNLPPHGGFPSFRDSRTIATVLHGAGYTTALVGKYLNRYGVGTHDAHYVPPGWDHGRRSSARRRTTTTGLSTRDACGTTAAPPPTTRRTCSRTRRSPSWHMRRGPFFLEFAPFGPHDPATPPPRYKNAFQQFSGNKPPSFDERDLSDKPAYIRKLAPLNRSSLGRRSVSAASSSRRPAPSTMPSARS